MVGRFGAPACKPGSERNGHNLSQLARGRASGVCCTPRMIKSLSHHLQGILNPEGSSSHTPVAITLWAALFGALLGVTTAWLVQPPEDTTARFEISVGAPEQPNPWQARMCFPDPC